MRKKAQDAQSVVEGHDYSAMLNESGGLVAASVCHEASAMDPDQDRASYLPAEVGRPHIERKAVLTGGAEGGDHGRVAAERQYRGPLKGREALG